MPHCWRRCVVPYTRNDMSTPREQLLQVLAEKSFKLGDFKLSSGGTSDYHIHCRTPPLDPQGARLTARVFLDEIMERGWRPQALGGTPIGADPIEVGVAM